MFIKYLGSVSDSEKNIKNLQIIDRLDNLSRFKSDIRDLILG